MTCLSHVTRIFRISKNRAGSFPTVVSYMQFFTTWGHTRCVFSALFANLGKDAAVSFTRFRCHLVDPPLGLLDTRFRTLVAGSFLMQTGVQGAFGHPGASYDSRRMQCADFSRLVYHLGVLSRRLPLPSVLVREKQVIDGSHHFRGVVLLS